MRRRLFEVLTCLSLCGMLLAQVETSTSIRGLVTDASGAAVPGATVIIRNTATNESRTIITNDSGFYAFPSIIPGTYDVTITHAGFKKAEVTGRVAQVSESAQVDVTLEVGQTSDSVTVSAAGAELLSTSNAEIGGVLQSRLVNDIPLNGRNFFDLAVMLPHVSLQNNGSQLSFAGFASNAVLGNNTSSQLFRPTGIFSAGNRDSATNVSIDGVNIQSSVYRQSTIQQPPSAIEEVRIHVSSTNAEVGNGVAAVNVITRSGSNQWHGEAYEYFRNDKLDANYFFSNLSGRPKPPYRQNQYGAAGGGAILKDKLFFFAAYEGLRVRQSSVTTLSPPPEDIRSGDFSNFHPPGAGTGVFLPTPIIYNPYQYDSRTGIRQPFPGNKIPLGPTTLCAPRPTCVDPVTAKFLQDYVLHPNTVVDGIPRYVGTSRAIVDSDQGLIRVDYAQTTNSRIYGRYGRTVNPSATQSPESLAGLVQNSRDQNAVVHWTKVFSAATVNDVMFGYARPYWLYAKDTSAPDAAAAIGLLNTSGLGGGPGFGNGYSMNSSLSFYLEGTDNIYHFADDLTHVRGRHSFKFGFQAIERRFYYNNQSNDKGSFTFTQAATAMCPDGAPGCAGLSTAEKGGNAFASYLLGTALNGLFQLNAAAYRGHKRYYGAYVQDSWRVSQRLTLNYGLRYEYWAPWFVPRHTVATFDETKGEIQYVLQNPLDYLDPSKDYGKSAPLNPNVPETGYTQGNKNFAPRFGLAYTVTPSTVFRAAYGIYYDGNTNTNQFSDISSAVGPFKLRYEPVTAASDQVPSLQVQGNFPFPGATAIPQPNSNPLSTFRFVRSYIPISSVQEWSASIQQRLGSDWAAEISYQGTHAIHLPQFIDVNPPALPVGPYAGLSINQRRHFPQWGVIGTWAPIGYGRYNGVAVSLHNNYWRGLTVQSSFTYAKNIVSSYLGTSDQGNVHGDYPYIWQGDARLTPRFRFVNAFTYEIPAGKGKRFMNTGVGRAVLGDWIFSGSTDFTSGAPNWVTTVDTSQTNYGAMPNRICDAREVPGGRDRNQWFNPNCFTQPAFGTFGNSNMGVYTDPGISNWNLGFAKAFPVPPIERGQLRFRADLFNAFNHTQWGPATATTLISNVNAGRISSTRPPRQVQFSLTYKF